MRSIASTAFYVDYGSPAYNGYLDGIVEVYNKSGLDVSAYKNGSLGYTAWNIYSDDDGESYLTITDDGFVIFDDTDICNYYECVALLRYIGDDTDIEIPSYVEIIGDAAFYGCDFIETITIPEEFAYLEDWQGVSYDTMSGCEQATIYLMFSMYDVEWDVWYLEMYGNYVEEMY